MDFSLQKKINKLFRHKNPSQDEKISQNESSYNHVNPTNPKNHGSDDNRKIQIQALSYFMRLAIMS